MAPLRAVVLALLVACAATPAEPAVVYARETIGTSVEGRAIQTIELGSGTRTILILATIHGDEAAGTPLVLELVRRLRAEPELLAGRRVLVVPVANPDGFARDRRRNARGVDLNRNFPAENFDARGTALSEPESRALLELIDASEPALVVSLHQAAACVDYDGPGEGLARAMEAACDLPLRRMGARPGSLGSLVGLDRGVPIVTLELTRAADRMTAEELWDAFGGALLAAIAWEEATAG